MFDRSKRTRPPVHPGRIIKAHYLEPLGLSVSALADHLGVSRKTMSKVVNGSARVTPDMAQRLSRALNTSVELWIDLQSACDVWELNQRPGDWQSITPLPGVYTAAGEQGQKAMA